MKWSGLLLRPSQQPVAPRRYGDTLVGCDSRLGVGNRDQAVYPIEAHSPTLEASRFLPTTY